MGSEIVWFRNLDGKGSFSDEIFIENIPGMQSLSLFDLDADNDMDILYEVTNTPELGWMENLDGMGSYSSRNIISLGSYIYSFHFADLDGDGDLDVIAIIPSFSIVWFENLDGHGSFSSAIEVDNNLDLDLVFTVFDLDNDGDMDIIAGIHIIYNSVVVWYENIDGQGTFSERQEIYELTLSSDPIHLTGISHADVNGDSKIDIVLTSHSDEIFIYDQILWIENLDGNGLFSSSNHILSDPNSVGAVVPADVDDDGDVDLLYFDSLSGGFIGWFKNRDGLGGFSELRVISTQVISPRYISTADIDGDGFTDIVSASAFDNKVAWYRSSGVFSIDDNYLFDVLIYPNPTTGILTIKSQKGISEIEIYNQLGQLVLSNSSQNTIDISSVSQGLYLMKITNQQGNFGISKIIKK